MKRTVWILVVAALLVGVFPLQARAVDLNVAGKSACLMDVTTGTILYEHNAHEPLAQGYSVKYTDQWCATFVSAAAIVTEMTDIIPTECGCQRQIGLFDALGRWEEDDEYIPLPGDIIFYSTTATGGGDNTQWSDHVGIVVGTNGKRIKVIEGNNAEAVRYRYLTTDDPTIRGYGLPDFTSKT